MAIGTALERIKKATADHDERVAALGDKLMLEIVRALAPLIPDGWFLTWSQRDDQYNDQDYHFGLDDVLLVSEREPRRGKCIKDEVKRVEEQRPNPYYGGTTTHVVTYGSPAVHEWELDDKCKPRSKASRGASSDEPGVVNLTETEKKIGKNTTHPDWCGLTWGECADLRRAFDEVSEDAMRAAFGDNATVTINRDGTYTVK